jgi:HK97 family phage prohead protease
MTTRHISGLIQKMDEGESEGHVFRFIASTDSVDRADDIVSQSWDLSGFNGNPVILQNHDHFSAVVGRALSAEVEAMEDGRKALVLTLQMDGDNPHNPDAQRLARQMADGFVNAGSVGFIPGSVTSRSSMPSEHAQHGARGFVLGSEESPNKLLEFSIVTVPMNAEALAAKQAGPTEARQRIMIREEVAAAIKAERALSPQPSHGGPDWWQSWEMP